MTKTKYAAIMQEEGMLDLKAGSATAVAEVTQAKGAPKAMGRPKTKPDSRQISLHLAVDLIKRIDAEADRIAYGNKSGLVTKILEDYFAQLKI